MQVAFTSTLSTTNKQYRGCSVEVGSCVEMQLRSVYLVAELIAYLALSKEHYDLRFVC